MYLRPLLIIGAGGTGVSTANRIKMLAKKAGIPAQGITTVCFDGVEFNEQREEASHLLPNEYIYTGGVNFSRLQEYREENPFLDKIVPEEANLSGIAWVGASQNRIKGAAMFGFRRDRIMDRIKQALLALRSRENLNILRNKGFSVPGDGKPAIHVICSAAGGTGSGSIAQLIMALKDIQGEAYLHLLRSSPFLAMADSELVKDRMRANEVATLLEVDELREFLRLSFVYDASQEDPNVGGSFSGERNFLVNLIAREILLRTSTELSRHIAIEDNIAQDLVTERLGVTEGNSFGINRLFISSSAIAELSLNTDKVISFVAKKVGKEWVEACLRPDQSQVDREEAERFGEQLLIELEGSMDQAAQFLNKKLQMWMKAGPFFYKYAELLSIVSQQFEVQMNVHSEAIEVEERKKISAKKMRQRSAREKKRVQEVLSGAKVNKNLSEFRKEAIKELQLHLHRIQHFFREMAGELRGEGSDVLAPQESESPVSGQLNLPLQDLTFELPWNEEGYLKNVCENVRGGLTSKLQSSWKEVNVEMQVTPYAVEFVIGEDQVNSDELVERWQKLIKTKIDHTAAQKAGEVADTENFGISVIGFLEWLQQENEEALAYILDSFQELGSKPWLATLTEAMGAGALSKLHNTTILCLQGEASQELKDELQRQIGVAPYPMVDPSKMILYHCIHGVPLRGLDGFAGEFLAVYKKFLKDEQPLHPITQKDWSGEPQKIDQQWWLNRK